MVACEQSSRLVFLMADLCGRHFWIRSLAGAAHLQMIAQLSEDELNENRNVMWTKRGNVRLVVKSAETLLEALSDSLCERFESEFICSDPKDCDLCCRRVKSAETLMEAHSDSLCERFEYEYICSDPSEFVSS